MTNPAIPTTPETATKASPDDTMAHPLWCGLGAAGLSAAELAALPAARSTRVDLLYRRARSEEPAALSLLAELECELTTQCRRLVRVGVGVDDAWAETIGVAWETVARGRPRLSHPSPRILAEAIWCRLRRHSGLRRRSGLDVVSLAEGFDIAVTPADRLERWPGLLGAAVAAGVLTPRQVVIVAQSRMEGRELADIARSLGRRYDAVRMERCRAEAALRDFARSYAEGDS